MASVPDPSHPPVTTAVLVPCFSGAPWDVDAVAGPLAGLRLVAPRLPEGLSSMEDYADALAEVTEGLQDHVVVGDSFGAAIALAHAVRRPPGLRALVISGGFASDPLHRLLPRLGAVRGLQRGPVYTRVTLPVHAQLLASRHDAAATAERPWTRRDTVAMFRAATPPSTYVARVRAARSVDLLGRLPQVQVPTLALTPAEDRLIDPRATARMIAALPDVEEVVLPETGHMFRFAHPRRYAGAIADFLGRRGLLAV